MTTSKQPVHPCHEPRNTHPPKLARANPPGHSQTNGNFATKSISTRTSHQIPAMLRYKAVAFGSWL